MLNNEGTSILIEIIFFLNISINIIGVKCKQ